MIEHIVLIKFYKSTSEAEKNELIRKTLALKEEIPGIVDIQQGHNFSERSQGYEMGLTVRFTDWDAVENYGPHPKHQELVSYMKEIGLKDKIVVDFEINV